MRVVSSTRDRVRQHRERLRRQAPIGRDHPRRPLRRDRIGHRLPVHNQSGRCPLGQNPIDPSPHNELDQPSSLMVDKLTTMPRAGLGDRLGRLGRLRDDELVQLNRSLIVFPGSPPSRNPDHPQPRRHPRRSAAGLCPSVAAARAGCQSAVARSAGTAAELSRSLGQASETSHHAWIRHRGDELNVFAG